MSSASRSAKYARHAAWFTSWLPGTSTSRWGSRLSSARRPARKVSASSNSRRWPDLVTSPVMTRRSGWGAPAWTRRVTSPQIRA